MFKERQTTQELGLKVKEGIAQKQIEQLINFSQKDPEIAQNTSDRQRFASKDEFDKWRATGRRIYVLEDPAGNLNGIIWFGKKELPCREGFTRKINLRMCTTTFAIRLYPQARGKGLAFEFMFKSLLLDSFHWGQVYPNIWLEVRSNNNPAVALYKKFGFRTVTAPDENGKILMVWHDLRWHM